MINRVTNGLDITLIILSMMLDVSIVCLYQKYMWISKEMNLTRCDIYLMLNKGGHFKAAIPKNGYKILVKIPEECRPLYITMDSTKEETKLNILHSSLKEVGSGKVKMKLYYNYINFYIKIIKPYLYLCIKIIKLIYLQTTRSM